LSSSSVPFSGRAIFRDGTLRIEGQARYPNDGIGPVVYVSSAPGLAKVEVVRIYWRRSAARRSGSSAEVASMGLEGA
jgi:hypothetical protein